MSGIPFVPTQHYRIPLLRKVFDGWPKSLEAPKRITTRRTRPFPEVDADGHFQVYAWEISVPPSKELFFPKNSRHYPDLRKSTDVAAEPPQSLETGE